MKGIFWHLLEMSVMAGAIVLAVLVLRLLLRKAPRWCVCLLWAVVALRLVCPVTFETPVGLMPTPEFTAVEQTATQGNTLPVPTPTESAPPVVEQPSLSDQSSVIDQSTASTPSVSAPLTEPEHTTWWLFGYVAPYVWLVGVAAMLAYTVGSYLRLRLRLRTATRLDGNVYRSERVSSPFILGVFAPRIYLPYGLPAAQQGYVLAHERAHLRRGDHILKLFAMLLLAVYWYNPLIWVGYAVFCRDLELACDERVVRDYQTDERQAYSAALLANSTSRRLSLCPLAFGEVGVKQRIKSVMNYKKPAFWVVIVAVVAAVATAVCLLTSPLAGDPPLTESTTFDAVVLTVYDSSILVEPDKTNGEYPSADKISVTLPDDAPTLVAGDRVAITHGGEILETYPAQIHQVVSIRKIKDAPKFTYPLMIKTSLEQNLVLHNGASVPVYYYALDGVEVTVDGQTMELMEALTGKKLTVETLMQAIVAQEDEALEVLRFEDGGSYVVRFAHICVYKKHTLELVDGESLFIGPPDTDWAKVEEMLENRENVYATARVVVKEFLNDTLVLAVAADDLSDRYTVSLDKLIGEKPQVGDELEILYDGRILTSNPARFSGIQSVKVVTADFVSYTSEYLAITPNPDSREDVLVSDAAVEEKTAYKVYYNGIKSVRVKTDSGYVDLLDALKSGKVKIDALLTTLQEEAEREGGGTVVGDGMDENGVMAVGYRRRFFRNYQVYSYYSKNKKFVTITYTANSTVTQPTATSTAKPTTISTTTAKLPLYILRYNWDGDGVGQKPVYDDEFGRALVGSLAALKETGETVPKIADTPVDENTTTLPITRGTVWVECEGVGLFRLNPEMTEICRVETHLGAGRVLKMTDGLHEQLRQAWYYYPYDYWAGTYENGTVTLSQKSDFASTAISAVAVDRLYLENKHHSDNNRITLRFTASESKTVTVRLESSASSDDLGSFATKEVTLVKGKDTTVDFTFTGFYNARYFIDISVDNTKINLTIENT